MQVIGRDNFDSPFVSDILIKEKVTKEEGKKICDEHNKNLKDSTQGWYYDLVEDDYKLWDSAELYE